MNSEIVKKYSLCELALLGILALGLAMAGLVVKNRSLIRLGDPIDLPASGLTVCLPTGSAWQSLAGWQYEQDNSFVLPAKLLYKTIPVVQIQWKYALAEEPIEPQRYLEKAAGQLKGIVLETAILDGTPKINYIHVIDEQGGSEMMLGVAVLDYQRILTLHVKTAQNAASCQSIFRSLAASMRYEKPAELTEGIRLLNAFGENAKNQFDNTVACHLIKNGQGSVQAGSIQRQKKLPDAMVVDWTLFEKRSAVPQKEYHFKSPLSLSSFTLEYTLVMQNGRAAVQMELNSNRHLQIRQGPKQTVVYPGPAAVSDMLLALLIDFYRQQPPQKICLDIIASDGSIRPAIISSLPVEQASAKAQEMASAIRVQSVGGAFEEYYYDRDQKPIGRLTLSTRQQPLIWEPASETDVKKHFKTAAPAGDIALHLPAINNLYGKANP